MNSQSYAGALVLLLLPASLLPIDFCQQPDEPCLCLQSDEKDIHGICRQWYDDLAICDCASINHFYDCADKIAGEQCTCMKGTPDALPGVCVESLGTNDPHPRYKQGDVYCNCDHAYRIIHDEL